MAHLTLSIVEIIILLFGAVILGITIHFFISSRRSNKDSFAEADRVSRILSDWKLKYFNDIEQRDKELVSVKEQLKEAEENSNIYSIEADEMRKQNKKLLAEMEMTQKAPVEEEKPDYIEQLREAQSSLLAHNEKINLLLSQIGQVKDSEEKTREILRENEELSNQVSDLKYMVEEKEKMINNVRQKEHLTKEMSSMLDNAYNEFNQLQVKIQKLEAQLSSSKMVNIEYEDLKESHYKMSKDFEEQKIKLSALSNENQELRTDLNISEEKLREANFQRQQLQKRVAYLEDLNNDLQSVSDTNKRLEGQLKRIGELESMLNVVSEERDQLIRRQPNE